LSDIGESAIAVVVIQRVGRASINGWAATCGYARAYRAVTLAGGTEVRVAANVEIQAAIAVIVEEGRAGMKNGARLGSSHSGFTGQVCEGAVAVIVVKNIFAVLRDVEIRKAVVVVITPDAAQAIGGAWYAGLLRHVDERSVAFVSIESVASGDAAIIEVASV